MKCSRAGRSHLEAAPLLTPPGIRDRPEGSSNHTRQLESHGTDDGSRMEWLELFLKLEARSRMVRSYVEERGINASGGERRGENDEML